MSYVMTNEQFVNTAKYAAQKCSTLYVKGCFGAPMTDYNKKRYTNNNTYNAAPARKRLIESASKDTFGFDCVCFIKGILWGWKGDVNDIYGGARFKSNGVPDFDDSEIMDYCDNVSTDFTDIQIGEILHIAGHVGIYIGDGLAAECTARWKDGVQITSVLNIGIGTVNCGRIWDTHGKLRFVEYVKPSPAPSDLPTYELHVDQIRKGSTGASVVLLQKLLNDAYYYDEGVVLLAEDGIAGDKTINRLIKYQDDEGLDGDGICGTATWSKLLGIKVVMDT